MDWASIFEGADEFAMNIGALALIVGFAAGVVMLCERAAAKWHWGERRRKT
jgi:hypothetical protein